MSNRLLAGPYASPYALVRTASQPIKSLNSMHICNGSYSRAFIVLHRVTPAYSVQSMQAQKPLGDKLQKIASCIQCDCLIKLSCTIYNDLKTIIRKSASLKGVARKTLHYVINPIELHYAICCCSSIQIHRLATHHFEYGTCLEKLMYEDIDPTIPIVQF